MKKDMHKEILDNIFELAGKKFGDDDVKKTKNVIDRSFDSDSAEDISDIFSTAEEYLFKNAGSLESPQYSEHLLINELGCEKKKENTNQKEEIYKSTENVANVLSSFEEDVTITMQHYFDDENCKTELIISSEGGNASINGMIRGSFGQAKTTEVDEDHLKTFAENFYGRIQIPFEKEEKKNKEKQKNVSWCDILSSSFPKEGNYSVSIRFVPMDMESNTFDINERIKKLSEMHNLLSIYAEQDRTVSSNISGNRSHGYTLLDKIPKGFSDWWGGKEEISINYSGGENQGHKESNKYAKLLIEEIDEEIYRLRRAEESCVWAIEIRISSDKKETLMSVASILTGALKSSSLELSWEGKECTALVAGTKEILPMMLFPTKEYNGLEFKENEEFSLEPPMIDGKQMPVGQIMQNSYEIAPFVLSEKALNRHAFVCGMTGSGKTNTLFKMIEAIDIPFLVIEPVKGEYRALSSKFENVNVWTMKTGETKPNTNIMQINPFWFPKNANIAFHIDSIKTIISSAFDLSAAMPNILEQCLYNIYIKAGWDLVSNKNIYANTLPDDYLYPTFSDLCREVEDYLEKADFGAELMGDYKGAMLSRLRSFVNGYKGVLLNTTTHPNYENFMREKNIIELEGLADDADKCLVMGTILVQYYQYLKLNFSDEIKGLKHLIVIEEAHRLFKNVKKKGKQDGPDMVGQLVDSLSNIMAEIRAFGEGFIIVDQSPTKIADDVIKNSATKIIHRIDDEEDIKILKSSLLIPDDRVSIPSLRQGEALIRSEGMIRPCKVKFAVSDVKEAYSLAESFKNNSEGNEDIAIKFAATSVLNDEEVREEIQDMILVLLLFFKKNGFDRWYDAIHFFLAKIIIILQEQGRYEIVNGRLQVIFEIISETIKGMQLGLNVKQRGNIHMFLMRFLELYYYQKCDYKVKPAETNLMQMFYVNHIQKFVDEIPCDEEVEDSEE